jgi:putative tryptophan/tyrosine transport system substrate-binding protein
MRRRDFIALVGGVATAAPLVARAQQSDRMARVAVFMNLAADDTQGQARVSVFREAMQDLGWTEGRNIRIDYRWGAGDPELYRRYAAELVALTPNVIMAGGGQVMAPLLEATRTVPIVFTNTNDPVALDFVASLARPGGNATGFINIGYGFSAKWLELLKQLAPRMTRAAVLRDAATNSGKDQFAAIQAVASSLQVEVSPIDLHNATEMEQAIAEFAREENGGLIATSSTSATVHRDLIITLAARHRLPAVYPNQFYVTSGGLISYGPLFVDQYRRAADYVDRILKGAQPADLPVQAPTRYETVLNLKTAKALGLNVPRFVFLRADRVIQ